MGHEAAFPDMRPIRVLLVNPPIFDFTAYDFWLRPYGMLRIAGQMRHACSLSFFDFLPSGKRDSWGRGSFDSGDVPKPEALRDIPRKFHRFGRPRNDFQEFLSARRYDAVLVQTSMTYWYPGIREVVEDVRRLQPWAKVVLGGVYSTLCPSHAQSLGADLAIEGAGLEPLWQLLSIEPEKAIPYWPPAYSEVGVIKITEGCPFRCTYCAAPVMWPRFSARPTGDCLNEMDNLIKMGATNIAFYDDALLYRADQALAPFLREIIRLQPRISFHTPNALNARFVTPDLARLMVSAGFRSFFFGLESATAEWQHSTGGKVNSEEFTAAVNHLRAAGARSILTYIIAGHPDVDGQDLEFSIRFAHRCGTRVMLAEFSPVPGTPDSRKCRKWADPGEPLSHNKTAFAIRRLGVDYLNRLKQLTHSLNGQLTN